ncbi:MAG: hypothetical protein SCH39_02855 [Methanosarcinales archaeon]|nr:hypothetical protein [ANME-2 cluster archaeon]MDW7775261.1 hypothetical protein [Methanosarcinales archaeon]
MSRICWPGRVMMCEGWGGMFLCCWLWGRWSGVGGKGGVDLCG